MTVGAIKTVCEWVKKVNPYNCKSWDRCTYSNDAKIGKKDDEDDLWVESLTPTIEGDLVSGLTIKSWDANM